MCVYAFHFVIFLDVLLTVNSFLVSWYIVYAARVGWGRVGWRCSEAGYAELQAASGAVTLWKELRVLCPKTLVGGVWWGGGRGRFLSYFSCQVWVRPQVAHALRAAAPCAVGGGIIDARTFDPVAIFYVPQHVPKPTCCGC